MFFETMTNYLKFCFLALGALLLSSCRTMYYPNMHNVANLKGAGDANVIFNPSNVQGSYAVTDNWYLQGNLQFKPSRWEEFPNGIETNFQAQRMLAEVGVGYTKALEDLIRFEVGGGYGIGQTIFQEERQMLNGPVRNLKYSAMLGKYYLQPAFVFQPKPAWGFTFSMRANVLDYFNVESENFSFQELFEQNLLDLNLRPHIFAEPAFGLRFGKGRLRLQSQMMWVYKLSDTPINHQSMQFSLSVLLKLNKQYLKTTEELD